MSADLNTYILERSTLESAATQAVSENLRTRLGRTGAALLLMLGGISSAEIALPAAAHADTLSYPWSDATALDELTGDYGYATCPPSDTGCKSVPALNYTLNGTTYGESDPWGYGLNNCTSYVAWKEESEGVSIPRSLGNGGKWYDDVPAKEQSSTPEAWDAAVEPVSKAHPDGHVAFIESVNSTDPSNPDDDNITVSEYNEHNTGIGDDRTGTAASMGFTEFVDFGKHPSGTSSTGGSGITNSDPTSKIAVAQVPSGALEVFARGVNDDLQTNWQTGPGTIWQPTVKSLGGDITGNPVAIVGPGGEIEVFARGVNNDVETIYQTSPGGNWSGWQSLSGDIVGDPTVVEGSSGALEWFARGANNDVQTNWQNGAGTIWQNTAGTLGGNITTDPVAVQGSDGSFEIFGRGPGGDVDTTWQSGPGGNWEPWKNLGGDIAPNQTIAVGQGASGAFEWFATGANGDLQTNWQNGNEGNWQSGANSMGGSVTGDVSVLSGVGGAMEVFAQGIGDDVQTIFQTTSNGNWSGWQSLGGSITGDPAVIGGGSSAFEWFARGINGDLQTNWQNGPGTIWQPEAGSFGGGITNNPLVFAQGTSGAYEAFMRGNGGDIQTIYQLSDGGNWSGWQSLGGDIAE